MTIKKKGPIAKAIEDLCVRLCFGNGTEAEFKEDLRVIVQQYRVSGSVSLLSVGMALQRSATEYCRDKADYLWQLADDVEPRIKQAWKRYQTRFLGVSCQEVPSSPECSRNEEDRNEETMHGIVACWHHGNEDRLRKCLQNGYCDLHPLAAECPAGRMSAEYWFHKRMKLKIGELVRFCVEKRKIVASGEIRSEPYKNNQPIDPNWPGAVRIEKVKWAYEGYCSSPPPFGSHRLNK